MRVLVLALASACSAAIGWCGPARAEDPASGRPGPLQVMADITLIDSHCRGVTVYYDALFRYGEDHDILPSSILPLGQRRKAFEAAMAWRLATATSAQLCSDVILRDDEEAPGVLKR